MIQFIKLNSDACYRMYVRVITEKIIPKHGRMFPYQSQRWLVEKMKVIVNNLALTFRP